MTDKDIDRFSEELFQQWNLKLDAQKTNNMSLIRAASIARGKCVLKFLIGAAPVIYGIPCYLMNYKHI